MIVVKTHPKHKISTKFRIPFDANCDTVVLLDQDNTSKKLADLKNRIRARKIICVKPASYN